MSVQGIIHMTDGHGEEWSWPVEGPDVVVDKDGITAPFRDMPKPVIINSVKVVEE